MSKHKNRSKRVVGALRDSTQKQGQQFYILQSDDNKMFKIGVTCWYKARHKGLEESTPFPFHCIAVYQWPNRSSVEALESAIKTRLADYRAFDGKDQRFDGFTEWFKIEPFTVDFMRALCSKIRGNSLAIRSQKASLLCSH